jgi:hypothetical protein
LLLALVFEGDRPTRSRKASEFADRIRVAKGLDPTLGIYAAYAYSDADILQQVQSVWEFMRADLGIDLFDVAMLAGRLGREAREQVYPFCPMLSQGWNLLRVRNVKLAPVVQQASENIRPSLWTTFGKEGIDILSEGLVQGQIL